MSFPSVGPNEVDIGCRRYWGEIICLSWGQGTSDSGAEVRERVSDARCLGRRKDAAAGLRAGGRRAKQMVSFSEREATTIPNFTLIPVCEPGRYDRLCLMKLNTTERFFESS